MCVFQKEDVTPAPLESTSDLHLPDVPTHSLDSLHDNNQHDSEPTAVQPPSTSQPPTSQPSTSQPPTSQTSTSQSRANKTNTKTTSHAEPKVTNAEPPWNMKEVLDNEAYDRSQFEIGRENVLLEDEPVNEEYESWRSGCETVEEDVEDTKEKENNVEHGSTKNNDVVASEPVETSEENSETVEY